MEKVYNNNRSVRIQSVGSAVNAENKKVILQLYKRLHQIEFDDVKAKQIVEQRLEEALRCIDNVFEFVGSPDKILGSKLTKHGEIAEHTDVEFQNAWDIMMGKVPKASFENVGRTAPEDYLVDGVKVQSKYINGTRNSLSKVLEHLKKYKDINFGRDGSYYVIPKDQYNQIKRILEGNTGNFSDPTVKSIKEKIRQIEHETGHSFFEVVKSGNVDYAEVQQGAIHKTLYKEAKKLKENSDNQKSAIEAESERKRRIAKEQSNPSLDKAAVSAGISAGISGGFELAFGIYHKCAQGKKIQDFSAQDWRELGIDTAQSAIDGGISGFAIYGLTNYLKTPAPVAAAGVSLALGLVDLLHGYCTHVITKDEFVEGCQVLAIHTAISAVGAFVGERVIPIPVLGAMIGSTIANNICSEILGEGANEAILYAAEYLHGSTISMIKAAKKISNNHQIIMKNTVQNQKDCEKIENNIENFMLKMEALL